MQLNKCVFPRVGKRSYSFQIFFVISESCTSAKVVAAVDVNTLANEVYKHNFPSIPLWAKTIEVSNQCLFYSSMAFVELSYIHCAYLVRRETKGFNLCCYE